MSNREMSVIINAWLDGKVIQYQDWSGKWVNLQENSPCFCYMTEYRVKPKHSS